MAHDNAPRWECFTCAHTCNLVDDDNCPTCGSPLPLFAEYRPDGWPLCPRCGEDELRGALLWDGTGDRPPLEEWVGAGMACYRCGYKVARG